jgi:hypothetical protein
MAMRSLAFSVFILIMSLSYSLINALGTDISIARNETADPSGNSYLTQQQGAKEFSDLQWTKNANSTGVFGLYNMANPQETQGGSFGKVTMTSVLYDTLFYSTTGFDTFMRNVLGISGSNWDGTFVVTLIDFMMYMVILNHGFVILQAMMNLFGVL